MWEFFHFLLYPSTLFVYDDFLGKGAYLLHEKERRLYLPAQLFSHLSSCT